ncbi:hypothetical protein [Saccharothrix lopnurensis]|uniref:Uncharacterized protein n=1 Tax=Saccharothrix lopnurensis TaxID=1670621 RepID=A0ABW1P1T6_9PSEU
MTLCTSPSCRTPDAHVEVDSLLCVPCVDRLWQLLRWIEWHLAMLSPRRRVRPQMVATAGGFGPSSPANDDALVLLDPRSAARGVGRSLTGPEDDPNPLLSAPAVLGGWAEQVWEARTPESLRSLIPAPATLREAVSTLLLALPWVARQAWVLTFADEVDQLARQVRGVVGDAPDKPVATCTRLVGAAPAPGAVDDRPVCGEDVTMWKHERDGQAPLVGARCGGGHTFTGFELIDLARKKHKEITAMNNPARLLELLEIEAAELWPVPDDTEVDASAIHERVYREEHSCVRCGQRAQVAYALQTGAGRRWLDLCAADSEWLVDAASRP